MTDLSAFSLAGKRVLVTGANTGIGQGIAVASPRPAAKSSASAVPRWTRRRRW